MHDDIFSYTVPSLLTEDERQTDRAGHICHPRTLITKLVNFSTSGPDDQVRLIFRGNGQRADVRLARQEARALQREIGRILEREGSNDGE